MPPPSPQGPGGGGVPPGRAKSNPYLSLTPWTGRRRLRHPLPFERPPMFLSIPIWALLVGLTLLFLGAETAGERIGTKVSRETPDPVRGHVAATAGGVLGLLALLLGFSFSMAVNRFEVRRDLVATDANAIGTTWLRAGMLRPPHDTAVRRLLEEYVDGRVRLVSAGEASEVFDREVAHAEALQDTLW